MRHILIAVSLVLGICLGSGCSNGGKDQPALIPEGEAVPDMVTHEVSMLISDSGVIRYRAVTPTWIRYSEGVSEPYQYFPDGIRFETVDSLFEATETILADTAYNWEDRQLWHLIKNVHVTSIQGEKFDTDELYWNMRTHQVYSDTFIHIERADNIIEGYGFTSTDDFAKYEIRQTSGIFPVKDEPVQNDTSTAQGQTAAPDCLTHNTDKR